MYTSSSRGSKRKADKNVDADFTSCLALERENPLRQPKTENRETDCSEYSRTRHSRFFSSVSNTDNNSTTERLIRIPLGACSLVVWQCIAFATSFLLASQTTSVAATASCMTTSYTTTKLSHAPQSGCTHTHDSTFELSISTFSANDRQGGDTRLCLA